jgi:plastocyanin
MHDAAHGAWHMLTGGRPGGEREERVRKIMATVFVAGLVLAGCSSGGGDNNNTTTGGGTTTSGGGTTTGGGGTTSGGGSANCSDVSADPDFQVVTKNFAFDPKCVIAKNTQKLDLENDDSATHTFTIDKTPIDVTLDPGSQQELDAPGDSLPPGTYTFYCRFHGNPDGTGMAGKITIK